METRIYYSVNQKYLEDFGRVYRGSINWADENSIANGTFFLTPVEGTNLYLLVISDYNNETKKCARLDRFVVIVEDCDSLYTLCHYFSGNVECIHRT